MIILCNRTGWCEGWRRKEREREREREAFQLIKKGRQRPKYIHIVLSQNH